MTTYNGYEADESCGYAIVLAKHRDGSYSLAHPASGEHVNYANSDGGEHLKESTPRAAAVDAFIGRLLRAGIEPDGAPACKRRNRVVPVMGSIYCECPRCEPEIWGLDMEA